MTPYMQFKGWFTILFVLILGCLGIWKLVDIIIWYATFKG